MPIINQPSSTLQTIIEKVRRLTRTPSEDQLTTQQVGDYINTFVLYDMPDHIKLFDIKTTFTWYCKPFVQRYLTDQSVLPITDPLYNFQNLYMSVHPPVYIAGNEAVFTQSRSEFFSEYPMNASIQSIGTGDGVTTLFSGTLSTIPVLAGDVLFTSVDVNNRSLAAYDVPANPFDGTGTLFDSETNAALGVINYITGVFSLVWATAPVANQAVNAQVVPYEASRPDTVLYYDNQFILRPVPDQPYAITMDVFIRPTALLDTDTSTPILNDFWQYIAYGAAKKIFEDRMDMENVQNIMPEFKEQETLIMRKTLMQLKNERVWTIYAQQLDGNGINQSPFGFGNNNF